MLKYNSILLSLFILLFTGCASDDFKWQNQTVEEDEYLIAFSATDPVKTVMPTRASDNERDKINTVTLLIFKDGHLLTDLVKHYPENNGTSVYTAPDGSHIGSIKEKKSKLASGDWYLVANAKKEITDFLTKMNGKTITADDFLPGINLSSSHLTTNSDASHIMVSDKADIDIQAEAQPYAKVFNLKRTYARVSVTVGKYNDKTKKYDLFPEMPFLVTEAALYAYSPEGNLSLAPAEALTFNYKYASSASDMEAGTWNKPDSYGKTTSGIEHLNTGDAIVTATYPCKNPESAIENHEKMLMIVKGHYDQGAEDSDEPVYDSSKVCYYAVPLPDLMANHHLTMVITDAASAGANDIKTAIDNAGGLTVKFVDETETIRDMVSDGENVLAVQDTVMVSATESPWSLPIIARYKKSDITLSLRKVNDDGTPDASDPTWLTITGESNKSLITLEKTDAASEGKLFTNTFSLQGKASKNDGSERSVSYEVQLEGTDLSRRVVILQQAPTTMDYTSLMDIKLTISGGKSASSNINYLRFINHSVAGTATGDTINGIHPRYNGGRQRNLGLHMPMPNGGNVKYTYTLTPKGDANIEVGTEARIYMTQSGNSYTFTFTDGTNWDYELWNDEIVVSDGSKSFSLDLYHTGFFHKSGAQWYYYEVFTQNQTDNKLHWLDRNLGATAAGMGVREKSGYLNGNWPLQEKSHENASMGKLYGRTVDSADIPEGWGLPTFSQMRSLTTQAAFNTLRMTASGNKPYYAPQYTFIGKEDGSKTLNIKSYFPANMKTDNSGSVLGNAVSAGGYYQTNTGTGTAGWYQNMVFAGMNVSTENTDFGTVKMSVKLCSGTYNPNVESTTFKCNVKGYTHVFLYYANTDGSKTYITTWPGEQVSVSGDINRYHSFEITPSMLFSDYSRLRVIFNYVEGGTVKRTNVGEPKSNKVKNREGIIFYNEDSYDKDAVTIAEGAAEGDWKQHVSGIAVIGLYWHPVCGDKVKVFGTKQWKMGSSEEISPVSMTTDGLYFAKVSVAETELGKLSKVAFHNGSSWSSYYSGTEYFKKSSKSGSGCDEVYDLRCYNEQGAVRNALMWINPISGSTRNYTKIELTGGNVKGSHTGTQLKSGSNGFYTVVNGLSKTNGGNYKMITSDGTESSEFAYNTNTLDVTASYGWYMGASAVIRINKADDKLPPRSVYLSGDFNNWVTTDNNYKFSTTDHDEFTLHLDSFKGKFKISDNGTLLGLGGNDTDIKINTTYTIGDKGGIVLPELKNVTFTYKASTKQLTVTSIQATDEYYYKINNNNDGNKLFSEDKTMTLSGNVWVFTGNCAKGNFKIQKCKKSDNTVVESIGSEEGNTTVTLNQAKKCKVGGGAFWFDNASSNYTFTFDPSAMTLTITGAGGGTTSKTKYRIYFQKKHNNTEVTWIHVWIPNGTVLVNLQAGTDFDGNKDYKYVDFEYSGDESDAILNYKLSTYNNDASLGRSLNNFNADGEYKSVHIWDGTVYNGKP